MVIRTVLVRPALVVVCAAAAFGLLSPRAADAQPSTPSSTTQAVPPGSAVQVDDEDDPAVLDLSEPDFVIVNLPTNLRLPHLKSNFRLTHRFVGNLMNGTFAENASNLFGLDQGAIIGFEFRMNLLRDLQAAAFRTNFDKTFLFYGKYDGIRQRGAMPVSISGLVSIEGTNNFQEKYAPGVGAIVSRKFGTWGALYAVPMWIGHTNASLEQIGHDHDHGGEAGEEEEEHDDAPPHKRESTTVIGLGARIRLTPTVYVVGEVSPRVAGYAPDKVQYGFGVEKRVGGHAFTLTFTNSLGTTFAQIARGGPANALYLGFNLGRKFF